MDCACVVGVEEVIVDEGERIYAALYRYSHTVYLKK